MCVCRSSTRSTVWGYTSGRRRARMRGGRSESARGIGCGRDGIGSKGHGYNNGRKIRRRMGATNYAGCCRLVAWALQVGRRPVQGGNWNLALRDRKGAGLGVMSRFMIATTNVGAEIGPDLFFSAPFSIRRSHEAGDSGGSARDQVRPGARSTSARARDTGSVALCSAGMHRRGVP